MNSRHDMSQPLHLAWDSISSADMLGTNWEDAESEREQDEPYLDFKKFWWQLL